MSGGTEAVDRRTKRTPNVIVFAGATDQAQQFKKAVGKKRWEEKFCVRINANQDRLALVRKWSDGNRIRIGSEPGDFDVLLIWEPHQVGHDTTDYREALENTLNELNTHIQQATPLFIVLHESSTGLHELQRGVIGELHTEKMIEAKYKHEIQDATYVKLAKVLAAEDPEDYQHAWTECIAWLDHPSRFETAQQILLPFIYKYWAVQRGGTADAKLSTLSTDEHVKEKYGLIAPEQELPKDIQQAINFVRSATPDNCEEVAEQIQALQSHLARLTSSS